MSEPVRKIKNETVAIEGFDDVFETSEDIPNNSEEHDQGSEPFGTGTNNHSEVVGRAREILTTTEAASRLGISSRAVINRLRAGTLSGERTKGKYKEEWRVFWEDVPNTSEQPIFETRSTSEASEEHQAERTNEFRRPSEAHDGSQLISELLTAHTEQVKAQSELIKYLSEQLKEKDQQIKLLTDSQHKHTSGWSSFWSWFTGKQ